jgi:hypothetical protein
MNNNISQITKLHPRLMSVASHAITSLEKKGYNPFVTVKAKEDTKANSFELKFRSHTGKTIEKPELVQAVAAAFKGKQWNIEANKSTISIAENRAAPAPKPEQKTESKSTKKEA